MKDNVETDSKKLHFSTKEDCQVFREKKKVAKKAIRFIRVIHIDVAFVKTCNFACLWTLPPRWRACSEKSGLIVHGSDLSFDFKRRNSDTIRNQPIDVPHSGFTLNALYFSVRPLTSVARERQFQALS